MLFTPVFGFPVELFELPEPFADELLEPAALELVELPVPVLLEAAELAELPELSASDEES